MTKRRFYRATLATIVWDPDKDKPLAEFVDGQFYTEDDAVAEKLIAAGYPEVSLEATTPPEIIAAPVPIITPDAKPAKTEEQALAQTKQRAAGSPPVADSQSSEEGASASEDASDGEDKPKKAKGRKIKRREK
jgi:hypothetical protein